MSIEITVKGKVQKVWYRQSTLAVADTMGVKGFAMNLQNGNVYIQAEAEKDVLDNFVEWCKMGPDMAQVDSVEVNEIEFKGFKEFQVIY